MDYSEVATIRAILLELKAATSELVGVAHNEHLALTKLDRNIRHLDSIIEALLKDKSST